MPERGRLLKRLRLADPDNCAMQTAKENMVVRSSPKPFRKVQLSCELRDGIVARRHRRHAVGNERAKEVILQREDGVLNARFLLAKIIWPDEMRTIGLQPGRVLPRRRTVRLARAGPLVARH